MTKVWDGFIRSYHWAQVALIGGCWWSAEQGEMVWHQWLAMTLMALWGARLYWGFFGSESARFSAFVKGPKAILAFARSMLTGKPQPMLGHNPLGAVMVLLMLLVLAGQMATGLFASDQIFTEGPLYSTVSEAVSDSLTRLHHLNFNLLLALIALHLLAVAWHSFKGEKLVPAMFTGRKPLNATAPVMKPLWQVWLVFALLWGGLYLWWGSQL
ncbi:cytochrome b/b6 domain-containing protein [Gallaecimonas sp. GXIMD1310]|uniref:cytochrome b/b6 domain-containing protein n=1 Tax=Gallaecimonas sp. GXIMD1310 TaxID=3131926 RepID=UPI003255227D